MGNTRVTFEYIKSININATADIDNTLEQLKPLLVYKQLISRKYLESNNFKSQEILLELLNHTDKNICKILGILQK